MIRDLLLVPLVLAVSGTAAAQSRVYSFVSDPNDFFPNSYSAGSVPDLDGDGVTDLLLGKPTSNEFGQNAGQLVIVSGASGATIAVLASGIPFDQYGDTVAGLSDVDGDGRGDFLVTRSVNGQGAVLLLSGQGFRELRRHWGFSGTLKTMRLGDLDGDGVDDYAVRGDNHPSNDGRYLRVFDGRTGALRFELLAQTSAEDFAESVAGIGDLDGDGTGDVLVGSPTTAMLAGVLTVHSGVDGQELLKIVGSGTLDHLGTRVAGLGDVDGDGVPDFVSSNYTQENLQVFSGANGTTLYTIPRPVDALGFGRNVAVAGDLNGDGILDFSAGATFEGRAGGSIRAFSGSDGSLLFEEFGDDFDQLGTMTAAIGDLNGDGAPEVLAGAPGQYLVFAWPDLPLVSDRHEISAIQGGTQRLEIDAPVELAGYEYIVLGSTSGFSPGQPIRDLTLPLNPDIYFDFTIDNPNLNPPFYQTRGLLDGSGNATAEIRFPPGHPGFVGRTAHHSVLVFRLESNRTLIPFVTNPVSLVLTN